MRLLESQLHSNWTFSLQTGHVTPRNWDFVFQGCWETEEWEMWPGKDKMHAIPSCYSLSFLE
jgi:hypothetical protein